MIKIDQDVFLEGLENGYFKAPNDIFELDFPVKVEKRVILKEKGVYIGDKYITTIRDLNTYERIIYLFICRNANNGKAAFPSYSTISKKCRISRKVVVDSIKILYENGFIQKTNKGHIENREVQVRKSYSNLYRINANLKELQHILENTNKNVINS